MKNKILEIINTNPTVKEIYENEGCFKNIVVPQIKESDDEKTLELIMVMLAYQCELYDSLINNIGIFGNKELIKKCSEDINKLSSDNE